MRRSLEKIKFSNYELFGDIGEAYKNLIEKVIAVTDNFAPIKDKRVKSTSQDCFDAQIMIKNKERSAIKEIGKLSSAC